MNPEKAELVNLTIANAKKSLNEVETYLSPTHLSRTL